MIFIHTFFLDFGQKEVKEVGDLLLTTVVVQRETS
jgi:hypothetical protein